jgi:sodium transport system permease protein
MERIAASQWEGSVMFLTTSEAGPAYQPMWIVMSIGIALSCMLYFATLRPNIDESEADYLELDRNIVDPTTSLAPA